MRKRLLGIAVVLGLLIPVVYLGVQLFPVLYPEYETQTAIVYTLADGIDVEGLAVRKESVIPYPASGELGYLVADGSRVSGGNVVAEVYAGPQQSAARARENYLNAELEMLGASQDPAQTGEGNVEIILKQQQQSFYSLLRTVDSGRYDTLAEERTALTQAANMLQVATGKVDGFTDRIAALTAERDAAAAAVGEVGYLSADTTGYFSSGTDGAEGTDTVEAIDALGPAELEPLIANPVVSEENKGAGKIVHDYRWYFYCVVGSEAAERFAEGQKVTIDFHYTGAKEVPATVDKLTTDPATGKTAVKLLCTYTNADTINLRVQHASINFKSYTGIRVDRDALHIVKDERGVYIRFGDLVQFKRVAPLFENEQYALLPVQYQAQDEKNEVVLYDEIIVSGKDLYDNKLL